MDNRTIFPRRQLVERPPHVPQPPRMDDTGPIFVNEQQTTIYVFDKDKRPVAVYPRHQWREGAEGCFFVQGEHYAQFMVPQGGLTLFRAANDHQASRAVASVGPHRFVQPEITPTTDESSVSTTDSAEQDHANWTLDPASEQALIESTPDATPAQRAEVAAYILKRRNNEAVELPEELELHYGAASREIADHTPVEQEQVTAVKTKSKKSKKTVEV